MEALKPPDPNIEALDLTIRFSASLPDLLISMSNPTIATTSTLKQQIRKHLPEEFSKRRIRLICAGKALVDNVSLASSLPSRAHSQASSRAPTPLPPDADESNSKSKGKAVIRDPPFASRIYIHCSIGDVELSSADLATEALLARPSLKSSAIGLSPDVSTAKSRPTDGSSTNTTTPAPRGFDRLLGAGFSPAEILSLRSQFLAIQAHTHTPDTMPDANTLRDLEDQWLDNDNLNATGNTRGVGLDEEGQAGALDDLLWGSVMGFFWPVGCLWWAAREDGIWSRRRKMAVIVGVLVNIGFGGLRWMR